MSKPSFAYSFFFYFQYPVALVLSVLQLDLAAKVVNVLKLPLAQGVQQQQLPAAPRSYQSQHCVCVCVAFVTLLTGGRWSNGDPFGATRSSASNFSAWAHSTPYQSVKLTAARVSHNSQAQWRGHAHLTLRRVRNDSSLTKMSAKTALSSGWARASSISCTFTFRHTHTHGTKTRCVPRWAQRRRCRKCTQTAAGTGSRPEAANNHESCLCFL